MACANAETPSTKLTQEAAEAAVLCLINEQRANQGAAPLSLNLRLRAAARQHANDARTIKWWAGGGPQIHVNPVTGTTPAIRIKDAGYCREENAPPTNENGYSAFYRGGVEYQGNTSPQAAVDWWMDSPDHRDTLLDPTYGETGVAVAMGVAERGPEPDAADDGAIFVQTFGGCSKPEPARLGEIWAWGKNIQGELGDGSTIDRHTAVHLEKIGGVVALVAGGAHNFALTGDGGVLAWGFNASGQLGDGTTTGRLTPQPWTSLPDVQALAGGTAHSLALMNDGSVMGWGANAHGQIGDGSFDDRLEPVPVAELSDVIAISANYAFSLALTRDGRVWAWGQNNWGQLGDGTTDTRPTPAPVADFNGAIAIKTGLEHGLAIRNDGSVWAWGANYQGQLGDGTSDQRLTPVKVDLPDAAGEIVAIGGGVLHSLALGQNGWVWAWGGNGSGQLGTGDTADRLTPVRPINMDDVIAIAVGAEHSVALKRNGRVWAWGDNSYGGQLGDGTTTNRSTPVRVKGLPDFVNGIVTTSHHTLAT
jgi:uncharacterized protein YkwD